MNISIALLSALLINLTLLVLAIGFKKHFDLVREIVEFHLPSIILCLITALAYLFKKELSFYLIDIKNIPKYLLSLTFIFATYSIVKSWKHSFKFFKVIKEEEEEEEEENQK